jgi:vacuolar protein sorting-associated protein 13A/C
MWERIVERLLEKYLSKYIEGIEKEKLRVGVLRGDVELEDLKVKQTALDDCGLGVSIVYGNVGRLSIGISWAKWMSQDFNLRLKIKNVYILLKPRAHDSLVSEEQLREKIRDVKEKQIIRLQKAFIDSIQRTTHISDDSTNVMKSMT